MKLTFKVNDADGVDTAIGVLLALREAFEPELPEQESVGAPVAFDATEPVKRRKPPTPIAVRADMERLREALRAIAVDRGVAWVRGVLDQHGAGRLGELTDAQVQETMHALETA